MILLSILFWLVFPRIKSVTAKTWDSVFKKLEKKVSCHFYFTITVNLVQPYWTNTLLCYSKSVPPRSCPDYFFSATVDKVVFDFLLSLPACFISVLLSAGITHFKETSPKYSSLIEGGRLYPICLLRSLNERVTLPPCWGFSTKFKFFPFSTLNAGGQCNSSLDSNISGADGLEQSSASSSS